MRVRSRGEGGINMAVVVSLSSPSTEPIHFHN